MPTDPVYARDYYRKHLKAEPPRFSRTCHDCGCPSNDYRCPACWKKLRAKLDEPAELDETSYSALFFKDDSDLLP